MKDLVFTGSAVALVTPFKDNKVDFEKLDELVEFHIAHKTDAIVVCGTTGESSTMPDEEHLATIERVVKTANKRITVIGGAGSNDTAHGIELCKRADAIGVDALLLVTPYYNKCSQKGLIRHYALMAENVNVPVILYNVPGRTGVNISVQTAYELSKVDNIVGIKEASGNIPHAMDIANACGDDLYIYSGNDDINIPLMSIGAKGTISVLANILPDETHDMCEAFANGDVETAKNLQLKYNELIQALFMEVNPIPIKTAMNLMGMQVGKLRMPLCEMEEKNVPVLKAAMEKCNLPIKD